MKSFIITLIIILTIGSISLLSGEVPSQNRGIFLGGLIFLAIVLIIMVLTIIIKNYKSKCQSINRIRERTALKQLEIKEKLPKLIEEINIKLDMYEDQISDGKDKYQIGRAIGRIGDNFQIEYYKLTGVNYTKKGQNTDIDAMLKRFKDITNSDVQIENGMEDFHAEQNRAITQEKKSSGVKLQQQPEIKKEIITKTFNAAQGLIPILVSNHIKRHKNYVVIHQTPLMKTFLGTYQTTVTMQKKE